MFNTMRATVALAVLLTTTGCVTPVTQYVAPSHETAADLEFAAAGLRSFYFHENGGDCTETRKLSSKDDPLQNDRRALALPTDKRIALTLLWGELLGGPPGVITTRGCNIIISFQLQAGRRYRLVGGADDGRCAVDIVDVRNGVSVRESINLKQMRHVQTAESLMLGARASTCEVKK
jgi:hypothetical protein